MWSGALIIGGVLSCALAAGTVKAEKVVGDGSGLTHLPAGGDMTPFDVRRFGAIANDGLDDSAAFQRAMDACLAAAGQDPHGHPNATETYTVHVPIGAFHINSTVNGACSLEGESRVGSRLQYDGTAPTTILRYDNAAHFSVKNLAFKTTNDDVQMTHLHLRDSVYFHVEDVTSGASRAPFQNNRVIGIHVESVQRQVPPSGSGEIRNYLYTSTPGAGKPGVHRERCGGCGIWLQGNGGSGVMNVVIDGYYNIEEANIGILLENTAVNTIVGHGTIGGHATSNIKLVNADGNNIIGVRLTEPGPDGKQISVEPGVENNPSENNTFIGLECFKANRPEPCASGPVPYGPKAVVLSGGDQGNFASIGPLTGPLRIDTGDATEGGKVNSKVTIRQEDGLTGLAVMNQLGDRRFALNPNADGSWTLFDGVDGAWNRGLTQHGGNLGIGTTAIPTQKLDVNGVVKATRFIGDGSGLTNLPVADLGPLALDHTNARVGIGTAIPSQALHIDGGSLRINHAGVGNIRRPDDTGVAFQVTNGVNTSYGTFQVNTALGDRTNLVVQNDGRVGIGTAAPKAKVQVAGGDAYLSTPGAGLILRSPNGVQCKKVSISNRGTLVAQKIPCP